MKILATVLALALASIANANPTLDAAAVLADPAVEAAAMPDNRTRAAAVLAVDEYVPDLGVTVTQPVESYPVGDQPTVDEGYPAK